MEQLLVRLGANHTDPISWLVYSRTEDEIIASGELPNAEALSSLTERAGQRSVIALAPSSEIYSNGLSCRLKLAARSFLPSRLC